MSNPNHDALGRFAEAPGGPAERSHANLPHAHGEQVRSPVSRLPRTPEEIDPNSKVHLGPLFRGTSGAQHEDPGNLRSSIGDLGGGTYLTQHADLAATYGGGPKARYEKGTRVVHSYSADSMYPEEVAYMFGGRGFKEPVQLVSGNGIPMWEGPWKGDQIEKALSQHGGIKAVIGTPDSIGYHQVSIREPKLLKNKTQVFGIKPR